MTTVFPLRVLSDSAGVELPTVGNNADGVTVVTDKLYGRDGYAYVFNGTSWDRVRGNTESGVLITHTSAGAGTVNGTDQTNYNARGLQVIIDITAMTGTPTDTVTIQGKDPTSGKYYTLLASTALNATGTTVLTVYPGCIAAANSVANLPLPRTWRVISVIAGGTPVVTATIAATLIV